MKEFDIAIIGAGPAGMTAAIYGQRANLKTCLIEKSAPGGKVITTAFVDNYPGFEHISGPDLAFQMYSQATKLGSEYIGAKAIKITIDANQYKNIILSNNEVIKAKTIIIATGMENKKLQIPGEEQFSGKGVSYCAICDGMFFKGMDIAVVGSGNSACEEAIYLSEIGKTIHLIIRGDKMKADNNVIDEVNYIDNIKVHYNCESVEIKGDDKVNEFVIRNKLDNSLISLKVSAVFPFIGLSVDPIDDNELKPKKTTTNFYIVDNNCSTSIDGIFAAGDINEKKVRQIATAINDGAIAALAAKDYIQKTFK